MTESRFANCMTMLAAGQMQGLKEVYDEYGRMIYSAVLNLCRDPHTAEDITSEFFLKLKNAAAVYRENAGHKKWLIISARNLAIDYMRKNSREFPIGMQQGEEGSHPLSEIPDNADTEEKVVSGMQAAALLDGLDEKLREIIHLKIYCGLTFSEISQMLHIPQGTVSWRYNTAVKRLKKIYEEAEK